MATIGIVQSSYTISEDEDVEVCVQVLSGTLATGVTFEFSIQTTDYSAFGM